MPCWSLPAPFTPRAVQFAEWLQQIRSTRPQTLLERITTSIKTTTSATSLKVVSIGLSVLHVNGHSPPKVAPAAPPSWGSISPAGDSSRWGRARQAASLCRSSGAMGAERFGCWPSDMAES